VIDPLKLHTAWIMERGGKQRIHQIVDIERISWDRIRDDISMATVNVVVGPDTSQQGPLADLLGSTGRSELAIWRGDERVWEGPITLTAFRRDSVEITARDVLHYAARTIMVAPYNNAFPNTEYVVERARLILATELARRDAADMAVGLPSMNVVPFIRDYQNITDARTSANTPQRYAYVFEHIDSLAARAGMDYTVVGRSIHLWDVSTNAMGQTRTLTENDFIGDLYVSAYGMELGTYSEVTDGQGNYGASGGTDSYYGRVERLETAYDEEATTAPSLAELQSQAERNLYGRYPTPTQVRVPDGSSLNMDGVLEIKDLVPGIYMPLMATLGVVRVSQMQKLKKVRVVETAEGEDVMVTLYPASKPDEAEEGS